MTKRCAALVSFGILLVAAEARSAVADRVSIGNTAAMPVNPSEKPGRAPQILSKPPLVYPELARQAHAMGTVVVKVRIGRDGQVLAAEPLSGPHLLRIFAQDAIRQWRYNPATVESSRQEVTTYVVLNYHLDEDE